MDTLDFDCLSNKGWESEHVYGNKQTEVESLRDGMFEHFRTKYPKYAELLNALIDKSYRLRNNSLAHQDANTAKPSIELNEHGYSASTTTAEWTVTRELVNHLYVIAWLRGYVSNMLISQRPSSKYSEDQ